MVELTVQCKGCGKQKTFCALTDRLLDRQIADSRWSLDGERAECPSCVLAVQRSYEDVAGRRSW